MVNVSSSATDELKSAIRGQLLVPGDASFDQARSIWNAMIDRRPALILRCAGAADVRYGVAFARDNNLPLAIRGGGHNIGGSALCDDGLVLDLSSMKSVRIDPAARRAYVEPGATLHDFDHEAQAFGLATPLGINSTTGVAGLTLGGGFGWLSRKYGMTIDNLISADIVTADGELLHVSADSHEDLFWAIRGGGGNFGVVTLFEVQAASGRPASVRRPRRAADRAGEGRAHQVPRRRTPAGRTQRLGGCAARAAAAVPAARSARQAGAHFRDVLLRPGRRRTVRGRSRARLRHAARRTSRPDAVRDVATGVRSAAHAGRAQLLEVAQSRRHRRRPDRRAATGDRQSAVARSARFSSDRSARRRSACRSRPPPTRAAIRSTR